MSQASRDYAREMTARSLDTICVHNITSEDIVFWTDKYGVNPTKTLVPSQTKDVGFGAGNAHMPRYKAERFAEDIIVKKINAISDAKWEKDSKVYRTRDEKIQHAQTEQIRTTDKKHWDELFPQVWLGVVEKSGNLDLPDPQEQRVMDSGSVLTDTFQSTGLADKPYEPEK